MLAVFQSLFRRVSLGLARFYEREHFGIMMICHVTSSLGQLDWAGTFTLASLSHVGEICCRSHMFIYAVDLVFISLCPHAGTEKRAVDLCECKRCHSALICRFVKCLLIVRIVSLSHWAVNLWSSHHSRRYHTVNVLMHYLVKCFGTFLTNTGRWPVLFCAVVYLSSMSVEVGVTTEHGWGKDVPSTWYKHPTSHPKLRCVDPNYPVMTEVDE